MSNRFPVKAVAVTTRRQPIELSRCVLFRAGLLDLHPTVPIEQVARFEKALTAARSVTTKICDRASGGAEHCQLGTQTLWHADFFHWISAKFGDDKLVRQ
jgi:hypothetical protein